MRVHSEFEKKRFLLKTFPAIFFFVFAFFTFSPSFATPPYQVVCYTLQTNKASTSSLTGSGGAINWSTDVPWGDLTVIADAFYQPNTNNTFTNAGAKGSVLINAAHSNGVRCIVSLGGAGQDGAFGTVCLPANRAAFASAVTSLVATNGYDGVDIDWETNGAASQADATAMMQILYQDIKALPNSAFDNKPRTLSFATVDYINTIYNMTTLGSYTDWCFYMGYDWYDCPNRYNGPLNLIKTGIANITNGTTWSYPIGKMILGCPLYTNDYTSGCGATEYNTLSILHMGTAGAYNSTYAEQSYTAPNSDIVYVDTMQSYCDKTNWAIGAGLKGIGMWDLGQGLPYTDSLMSPIWSVIGGTNACLTVVGPTATFTSTKTFTPTATRTSTPTITNTPANTATSTATKTFTSTPSSTPTNSSSPTASNTATKTNSSTGTPTSTGTSTFTPTRTSTPTSTLTNTPANTSTFTGTPSSTPTRTNTSTGTATFTHTSVNTSTGTPTSTPSSTATKTGTPTITASSTSTKTLTFTSTSTATVTSTPTDSTTPTSSATLTASATPSPTATKTSTLTNTAVITPTPSSTPTSTRSSTPSNTSTTSFTATNTYSSTPSATRTFTSTVTSTPTLTATSTNTSVITPTPSATATHSSTPSSTSTSTFTVTNTFSSTPTATSTRSSTPTGTATRTSTPSSTATGTFTTTASFTFTPLPLSTFTPTLTATPTKTWTSVPTSTFTFTPTSTSSPTASRTPTVTRTLTPTPNGNQKPILYPNPATGDTVQLLPPAFNGTGEVRVEIFSSSFRKVSTQDFGIVPSGAALTLRLVDNHGSPLADGIYYVRVRTPGAHSLAKLMILR